MSNEYEPIRVRTPEEAQAFITGYKAGARDALKHGEEFVDNALEVIERLQEGDNG